MQKKEVRVYIILGGIVYFSLNRPNTHTFDGLSVVGLSVFGLFVGYYRFDTCGGKKLDNIILGGIVYFCLNRPNTRTFDGLSVGLFVMGCETYTK
jgi:hypothetical protein